VTRGRLQRRPAAAIRLPAKLDDEPVIEIGTGHVVLQASFVTVTLIGTSPCLPGTL
jgi:hypothetical protein